MTTQTRTFLVKDGTPVLAYAGKGPLVSTTRHKVPEEATECLKAIFFHGKKRRGNGPGAEPSLLVKRLVGGLCRHKHAFCMNPLAFTKQTDQRIACPYASEILARTRLGQSLERVFKKAGLFGFIDRLRSPDTQVAYRGYLKLLLASLCMSINGIEDAEDIPVQAFEYWLANFRTEDGMRWRHDLWGAGQDVHFRCLREVVQAFARLSNAPEVARLSGQIRQHSNGTDTWKFFRAKAQGVEAEWLSFYDDWFSQTRASRDDSRQMLRLLCKWSSADFPSFSVAEIMTCNQRDRSFYESILASRGGSKNTSNIVRQSERFSAFVEDSLRSLGVQEALWPLVAKSDLAKAQEKDRQNGRRRTTESRSVPLPPYLVPIVKEILEEGENGWPGSCTLFRETYINAEGIPQRKYSPVLPTYFQVLLILPLRGVQLSRFDSGEGDSQIFDGGKLTWIENRGPAARYWQRREGKSSPDRGFARRVGDVAEPVTGFFINTNKTGDPYVIPWEHPELHRLLSDLRVWQGQHFPMRSPLTPKQYVGKDEKADEDRLSALPTIFPLFRLPSGRRNHMHGAPPSWRRRDQAWQEVMLETERRWNQRNPDKQISIVKCQPKTGQPHSALYNLHGLRVAGLTRLFMSGVPLEILSKLVAGHAGLVMTLYYLKFKPADIHRHLEAASKNAGALSDAFIESFRSWSFDDAKRKAVSLHEGAIQTAVEQEPAHKLMYSDVTIGMCPFAGNRCNDGGEAIPGSKNNKGQYRYGAVEGGSKNCIMCRHFITGPAYMLQLWLFGTTLLDRFDLSSRQIGELEKRREAAVEQRLKAGSGPDGKVQQMQISALDIQIDAVTSTMLLLLKGIHRTARLLEMCEQIRLSAKGRRGVDIVVQDTAPVVELAEVSDFERSAIITASSRLFSMMHNGETEARRNAFLDKMLWDAGGTPLTFAPLTPDQKRYAQDCFTRILLERVDRTETQALVEGRLKLQDVGLTPELDQIAPLDRMAPLYSGSIEHEPTRSKKPRHRES